MNFPVLKGTSYVLVHAPDMIIQNGTTQTTEKALNPNSEYLKEIPNHIRKYEEVLNYLPNQVYIGNKTPDDLRQVAQPWSDPEKYLNDSPRYGKFGEIMPEHEFIGLMKICDAFDLVLLNSDLTMAIESARRIVEVLETKPSIVNSGNNIHKIEKGFIEFKNVNFKYSKDAKENVLSDISFKIPQGSNVGIIGATGSGKSTLVQLIPRLYDIQSGEILIDDINIKDIDLVHLRDMVAMVLQKNTLFFGTVAENLRWGNKDASIEQLDEVCKIAQAKEIVDKLPNGYETIIEQGGANLSGGQKQRLCIARALLKKPKILIFDDSTSAVDTKTDELIRRGLESYMKESTKIIISQRILSVQNSDIIFVLEKGKIVAQGNHTDLINQEGLYRQLFLTQQGGAVDEN